MARIIEIKNEFNEVKELTENPTQNNTIKKERKTTEILKKQMLSALESSLGVVKEATKTVGINRSTYYDWLKNDYEFKQAVDEINEGAVDFAETALYNRIEKGDTTAIIFYLKTKGKKRGYVEKTEIDLNPTGPDLSGFTTDEIINLLND